MAHPFSDEVPALLRTHLEHLTASAISLDVIKERGYRSAMGKKELADAGFSTAQQRAPGILIPLHGVDGSIAGYQYRPNKPRVVGGENERVIKYENPVGSSTRLDVPPRCREGLGNPTVDVWFTEGVKKVDALATAGVCAVGLTGVWGFKGKNKLGGTAFLADFDYIALKNRHCWFLFDSDLSSNANVRKALDRLAEHLSRKGAVIHLLFLPPGPGGEKTGADDYLAAGHSIEDLKVLEHTGEKTPAPPKIKRTSTQYDIIDGLLCWLKPTMEGVSEVPLCNFNARVTEDILRDNGVETNRFFKIEGQLPSNQLLPAIEITAAEFTSLNWVTAKWGMKTVIAAGQSAKDRLREAIQLQSKEAPQRIVYTHTGWREIDGEVYFLSCGGAMGREDIEVELEDPPLRRYQLLDPTGSPVEAIKKSFDFHLVASPEVSIPLWAVMYLAPLSELIDTSFTLWLVGASGAFKSTLSALALCHFGTFDSRHMPASWRDTAKTLERLLFICKDLPLIIDDWAPGQDMSKARELEVKAEYVIRAQGNRQGRQRMKADTTIRAGYPPRGILVTSGEQLPSGHSHTARIFSVELEKTDVDLPFMCTAQDEQYFYCVAMSHYIAWLKSHWQHLKETLPRRWRDYRDKSQEESKHPRLPEVIAGLTLAIELVTEYALEHNAIDSSEAQSYRDAGWDIFNRLASKQAGRIEDERPGVRAIDLWRTMLDQGAAIWWSKDDDAPRSVAPGVTPLGWIDNSDGDSKFLLNPKAAYGALVQYGQRIGQPFTFKEDALWKDLRRLGYSECQNGRNMTSAWIYGKTVRVVKLKRL